MIVLPMLLAMASADRLPPALPVPIDTSAEEAVLVPINALFAAFEAGDAAAVLRLVYPDGRVTAVGPRADGSKGVRLLNWTQFAERIKPEATFRESITNPAISVDDDIAMVWAPFVVRVKGKVASCGYDHFDLVREGGAWKVMNLSFSSRMTGCEGA